MIDVLTTEHKIDIRRLGVEADVANEIYRIIQQGEVTLDLELKRLVGKIGLLDANNRPPLELVAVVSMIDRQAGENLRDFVGKITQYELEVTKNRLIDAYLQQKGSISIQSLHALEQNLSLDNDLKYSLKRAFPDSQIQVRLSGRRQIFTITFADLSIEFQTDSRGQICNVRFGKDQPYKPLGTQVGIPQDGSLEVRSIGLIKRLRDKFGKR